MYYTARHTLVQKSNKLNVNFKDDSLNWGFQVSSEKELCKYDNLTWKSQLGLEKKPYKYEIYRLQHGLEVTVWFI